MASRVGKIYVCDICGNEVEFIKDSGPSIICCGEPMRDKEKSAE